MSGFWRKQAQNRVGRLRAARSGSPRTERNGCRNGCMTWQQQVAAFLVKEPENVGSYLATTTVQSNGWIYHIPSGGDCLRSTDAPRCRAAHTALPGMRPLPG